MHSPSRRGNALLLVVIVMGVLAVLAAAALSFTGRERGTAHAFTRNEALKACADAARNDVLARLRLVGVRPTDITFTDYQGTLPMSESETAQYKPGHMTGGPVVTVNSVGVVERGVGGTTRQARDMANTIGAPSNGGQYYSFAVNCSSGGRQLEIEMLVRFGI